MNEMMLLMMVSRVPPIVTFTVTVNGVPAVAVAGAEKLRTACGVAQLNVSNIAIVAVNKHNRRAGKTTHVGLLRGVMARLANANIDSEDGSVNVNTVIRELRLG